MRASIRRSPSRPRHVQWLFPRPPACTTWRGIMEMQSAGPKMERRARRRVAKARKAYTAASKRVERIKARLARAQEKLANRARRGARQPVAEAQDGSAPGAAACADAYCVKCRAKRSPREVHPVVLKNGRRALQGPCPTCGTTLTHMLRGPEAQPAPV